MHCANRFGCLNNACVWFAHQQSWIYRLRAYNLSNIRLLPFKKERWKIICLNFLRLTFDFQLLIALKNTRELSIMEFWNVFNYSTHLSFKYVEYFYFIGWRIVIVEMLRLFNKVKNSHGNTKLVRKIANKFCEVVKFAIKQKKYSCTASVPCICKLHVKN